MDIPRVTHAWHMVGSTATTYGSPYRPSMEKHDVGRMKLRGVRARRKDRLASSSDAIGSRMIGRRHGPRGTPRPPPNSRTPFQNRSETHNGLRGYERGSVLPRNTSHHHYNEKKPGFGKETPHPDQRTSRSRTLDGEGRRQPEPRWTSDAAVGRFGVATSTTTCGMGMDSRHKMC